MRARSGGRVHRSPAMCNSTTLFRTWFLVTLDIRFSHLNVKIAFIASQRPGEPVDRVGNNGRSAILGRIYLCFCAHLNRALPANSQLLKHVIFRHKSSSRSIRHRISLWIAGFCSYFVLTFAAYLQGCACQQQALGEDRNPDGRRPWAPVWNRLELIAAGDAPKSSFTGIRSYSQLSYVLQSVNRTARKRWSRSIFLTFWPPPTK